MRTATLTRYHLESVHERMNVLLDDDSLFVGVQLTLEEIPGTLWTVTEKHETIDRATINRGWNNNI